MKITKKAISTALVAVMAINMAPAKARCYSSPGEDLAYLAIGTVGLLMVLPVFIVGGAVVSGVFHAIGNALDDDDDKADKSDKKDEPA